MKPWKCQICGETYLGSDSPVRCPYCGAGGENLKSAAQYIDYEDIEVSKETRKKCFKALDLELNNTAFYRKAAANAENQVNESIFKRLGKHEDEHAELIAEMIGEEEGELPDVEIPDSDAECYKEAHDHEQSAINFYIQIAREAPEPRVKQVFRVLADIEQEHLNLSNIYK